MKYLFMILFLPTFSSAEVIHFYESCSHTKDSKNSAFEEILNRTKKDCWSRIFCNDWKKFPRISLYHACKINGSYRTERPIHPETYFDFGNSLFGMTEKLNHGFNSISFQGQKVFLTGLGINEDGELVSRVIQNYINPNADNRDHDTGKKLFESKNGFYEFKDHEKRDELYFYQISSCKKDSIRFPQFKWCFTKQLTSY